MKHEKGEWAGFFDLKIMPLASNGKNIRKSEFWGIVGGILKISEDPGYPRTSENQAHLCLALGSFVSFSSPADLDETLIHSSFLPMPADHVVPISVDGQCQMVYVKLRPHLHEFLDCVSKIYEVPTPALPLEQAPPPLARQ